MYKKKIYSSHMLVILYKKRKSIQESDILHKTDGLSLLQFLLKENF